MTPRDIPRITVREGVYAYEFSSRTVALWRDMFVELLDNLDKTLDALRAIPSMRALSQDLIQCLLTTDKALTAVHTLAITHHSALSIFFHIPYVKDTFRGIFSQRPNRSINYSSFRDFIDDGIQPQPADEPPHNDTSEERGPQLEDLLRMRTDDPLLVFRNWAAATTAWTMAWSSIPKSSLVNPNLDIVVLQVPHHPDARRTAPIKGITQRTVEHHLGGVLEDQDKEDLYSLVEILVGRRLWDGGTGSATGLESGEEPEPVRIHFETIVSAVLARVEAILVSGSHIRLVCIISCPNFVSFTNRSNVKII